MRGNPTVRLKLLGSAALLAALYVLFCAVPRFAPSEITLEELQASEAFREAAAKLADPSVQLAWGEPLDYSGYLPGGGAAICVPYACAMPCAVGTAGSSDWTFTFGVLLWDAEREQALDASAIALEGTSLRLTPDKNTALTRLKQDPKTGSAVLLDRTEAAACGVVAMGTKASTLDSAVDPNETCALAMDWTVALRPKGLLPSGGVTVSLSAQAAYQNNVQA